MDFKPLKYNTILLYIGVALAPAIVTGEPLPTSKLYQPSQYTLEKLALKAHGFDGNSDSIKTLNCGCKNLNASLIDARTCGIATTERYGMKINQIVWQAAIPSKEIAMRLPDASNCWSDTSCLSPDSGNPVMGHKCCLQKSKTYSDIFSDLNILHPQAESIVNYRNVRLEGVVKKPTHQFGICRFKADSTNYETSPLVQGISARARLYLNRFYGLQYTKAEISNFQLISDKNPPLYNEKKASLSVKAIQGFGNPYVIDNWHTPERIVDKNYQAKQLLKAIENFKDLPIP